MQTKIDQLHGHIIICGFGRMGSMITEELNRESLKCVVVDLNPSKEVENCSFGFVQGDATEDSTLLDAGLMRAKALVACLSQDADNVYVTLTARGLRSHLTIISRANQPSTEAKLKRAGADSVILPQIIGATKAAALLLRPHVVDFVEMASRGVNMEMAQYEVDSGSKLVGVPLRDSALRERTGVIVVAIKHADGSQVFSPGPTEVIREADQLILLGQKGLSDKLDVLRL